MLLAGIGGALVPEAFLPGWTAAIAPAVPSYWAMRGYREAILGGHGGVVTPIAILLLFSVVFTLVARWRFRIEDTKVGIS